MTASGPTSALGSITASAATTAEGCTPACSRRQRMEQRRDARPGDVRLFSHDRHGRRRHAVGHVGLHDHRAGTRLRQRVHVFAIVEEADLRRLCRLQWRDAAQHETPWRRLRLRRIRHRRQTMRPAAAKNRGSPAIDGQSMPRLHEPRSSPEARRSGLRPGPRPRGSASWNSAKGVALRTRLFGPGRGWERTSMRSASHPLPGPNRMDSKSLPRAKAGGPAFGGGPGGKAPWRVLGRARTFSTSVASRLLRSGGRSGGLGRRGGSSGGRPGACFMLIGETPSGGITTFASTLFSRPPRPASCRTPTSRPGSARGSARD